jgi:hypothetical protein
MCIGNDDLWLKVFLYQNQAAGMKTNKTIMTYWALPNIAV